MAKDARYRGGSIASVVLLIVIAGIILIVGAVWLRHRSDVARKAAVDTASITSEGAKTSDGNKNNKSESKNDNSDEKKENSSGAAGSGGSHELPESGSAQVAVSVISVGFVTYAFSSYMVSRRRLS